MKPFEKALIQSILDDYDKIIDDCQLPNQNSHGVINLKTESGEYDVNQKSKCMLNYSLWVDEASRMIYLMPKPAVKQLFFCNGEVRSSYIRLLEAQGYVIQK